MISRKVSSANLELKSNEKLFYFGNLKYLSRVKYLVTSGKSHRWIFSARWLVLNIYNTENSPY